MNKQYQNELESSLYYANKKIDELKQEIEKLKKERQFIIDYIEKNCVYDEHLMGYCFGLTSGEVRTLMYELNKKD